VSGRRPDDTKRTPQASIGVARMLPDGTLVLDLRATDAEGRGFRGDARFVYTKSHPEYAEVLKHLGAIAPGESKPVPPWPGTR
jgi:hypothetical protein